MSTSLDRKLERVAREIASKRAAEEAARGPRKGLTEVVEFKMLPENIWESAPGVYQARCVCCEQYTQIPVDISEIPDTGYEHYCGGSPRCLP